MSIHNASAFSNMLHALGVQRRGKGFTKGGWRNHYSTTVHSNDDWLWLGLWGLGLAEEGITAETRDGKTRVWRVSAAGIKYLQDIGFQIEVTG